jgi:diguanylate cyclase (GGDEF)-like protein
VEGSEPPDSNETPAFPRISRIGLPRIYADNDGTETDQTALVPASAVRRGQHPTLLVIGGAHSGHVFRLEKARTTLGRAKGSDICLADLGVSRLHCVVDQTAQGCFVEDQGSRNGTIVNGKPVYGRVPLAPGDRIGVGPDAVLQYDVFDDAQQDLAKRLYENATRDQLTKAYNRLHFGERLVAEMSYAVRHREPLGLVLFDIDHFKRVNDTLGHLAGDDVLRTVSGLASATLRSEDLFARYGGEEFVVLARGRTKVETQQLAERLRVAMEGHAFRVAGTLLRVTVSLGIAELGEVSGPDPQGLAFLGLADQRLYRAKDSGRNRVVAD